MTLRDNFYRQALDREREMREKMEREKALAEKRTQELLQKMEKYQQENAQYQRGNVFRPIFICVLSKKAQCPLCQKLLVVYRSAVILSFHDLISQLL